MKPLITFGIKVKKNYFKNLKAIISFIKVENKSTILTSLNCFTFMLYLMIVLDLLTFLPEYSLKMINIFQCKMTSLSKVHPSFFVSFCTKLDKCPKRNVKFDVQKLIKWCKPVSGRTTRNIIQNMHLKFEISKL